MILGGSFGMGSPYAGASAQPVHAVTVPTFEMLRTEITVSQYGECVDAGSCTTPDEWETCNWNASGYENHPVNCLNWHQAVDFCTWAGGRLPSEAEWEYGARSGGQDLIYPWGNDLATCTYAVMFEAGVGCGTGRTMAVCSKPAGNTTQGLCDMAGNLSEWVQDYVHSTYDGAPIDGSAWEDSGSTRVVRGGEYGNTAYYLRAAFRSGHDPPSNLDFVGARCVRDAS
jgi:iron(II)-dependent oxidoreductase